MQVQSFCESPKCMLQKQEENVPEEGGRQKAAIFHTALDVKGLRHAAFVLHCRLCAVVEGPELAV